MAEQGKGSMDAQICAITVCDPDGGDVLRVVHTASGTIGVEHDATPVMDLSYGEARALVKAINCLLSEISD